MEFCLMLVRARARRSNTDNYLVNLFSSKNVHVVNVIIDSSLFLFLSFCFCFHIICRLFSSFRLCLRVCIDLYDSIGRIHFIVMMRFDEAIDVYELCRSNRCAWNYSDARTKEIERETEREWMRTRSRVAFWLTRIVAVILYDMEEENKYIGRDDSDRERIDCFDFHIEKSIVRQAKKNKSRTIWPFPLFDKWFVYLLGINGRVNSWRS